MSNDSITAFYELGFERDRLFGEGEPRLELARTLESLDRFLPSEPAQEPTLRSGRAEATFFFTT